MFFLTIQIYFFIKKYTHIINKWLTFVNLKMLIKNIFVKITKNHKNQDASLRMKGMIYIIKMSRNENILLHTVITHWDWVH